MFGCFSFFGFYYFFCDRFKLVVVRCGIEVIFGKNIKISVYVGLEW